MALDAPTRTVVRAAAPQVHVTGESDARAGARLRRARPRGCRAGSSRSCARRSSHGPVLVHTPRFGYQPALACDDLPRAGALPALPGPLGPTVGRSRSRAAAGAGTVAEPWACPHCQGDRLRAPVVGSLRTAEEWGRSFPRTCRWRRPAVTTCSTRCPTGRRPAIVIATPGAEPVAEGGYAAAVLLDTWLSLSLPGPARGRGGVAPLVRRSPAWSAPATTGGRVIAVGEPAVPALQALVRWDPAGFAARELAERTSAHLTAGGPDRDASPAPPEAADRGARGAASCPRCAEVLGPVDVGPTRPRASCSGRPATVAPALSKALSARCRPAGAPASCRPVRVQVDPADLV